jgi:hypothetical protein
MDACVAQILGQIENPLLMALNAICTTAVTALNAMKISQTAKSMSTTILLTPLRAQYTILTSLLEAATSTVALPTDLIEECPQLKQFNYYISMATDVPTQGIRNITNQIENLLSVQAQNDVMTEKLDEAIAFFNGIQADIQTVLQLQ